MVVLVLAGGLIYFRFFVSSSNVVSPASSQTTKEVFDEPIEVPKTLPEASVEDNVKALEKTVTDLVSEVNDLKAAPLSQNLDQRLKGVEAVVTELKVRVSNLEKGETTTQSTSSKSATAYIPLGSGGGGGDRDWTSNANYLVTIDPAEYPGYANMQLEVNFRLTQKSGTAYARLFNVTDTSAIKGEVSTTSDAFGWQTTYNFTLPSGKKTYTLQIKSTEGVEIQIQSARIRVNF